MSSSDATHADPDLPAIDDRLAIADTRYEVLDGELIYVPPAHEPHATLHVKIATLVAVHAAEHFTVACDMLTRTSATSDVAPDVSVFPTARDPSTNRRQLEQLAFEVVSTTSLSYAGRKAATLAERGVRRVFAIDVERGRALEWSRALGSWSLLDSRGCIEDAALAVPLPIWALLTAAGADDLVAAALLAKQNAVLEAVRAVDRAEGRAEGRARGRAEGHARGRAEGHARGRAEGHARGRAEGHVEGRAEGHVEGRAEGQAQAVITLLEERGFVVGDADRARILGERDPGRLRRWIARAARCAGVAEVIAEP